MRYENTTLTNTNLGLSIRQAAIQKGERFINPGQAGALRQFLQF